MHPPTTNHLNHLIIVCCHAIYKRGPTNGASEDEWIIEPFQKGETPTFTAHVVTGLRLAAEDPHALLVFSGGPTKQDRTSLAEGESYFNLAKDNAFFNLTPSISSSSTTSLTTRITTENHATDSHQNLLFSLLKFRSVTARYPTRITVVTHEFKRARFLEVHFPALGLGKRVDGGGVEMRVVGINPPPDVTPLEVLVEGEEKGGIGVWRGDRYGSGCVLGGKRVRRGWDEGSVYEVLRGLEGEEGEVVGALVRWDGGLSGNQLFEGMEGLPWYS
ncbi:DUF218 domain protein [Aspergillus homomorphus CBS 101889]|uniref:DUF218 domain-containing protein n=1 Tax=Aspergillus homomorphus (strain CBS 101889) TaxID=1450537 RepID=A0A395HMB9_ASPHC|nr:hypothetical protein BO97DRAFT_480240 [Aspergillus homomorphus CBS 101889]RAL09081.1 hypothetical protein BO97DRAFT_480240 [Aspergillus homomorphus CBS 101889]